jgi:hypothetical protein
MTLHVSGRQPVRDSKEAALMSRRTLQQGVSIAKSSSHLYSIMRKTEVQSTLLYHTRRHATREQRYDFNAIPCLWYAKIRQFLLTTFDLHVLVGRLSLERSKSILANMHSSQTKNPVEAQKHD